MRTRAALSREVYGCTCRISVFGPAGISQLDDLEDQFRRIAAMADSQRLDRRIGESVSAAVHPKGELPNT